MRQSTPAAIAACVLALATICAAPARAGDDQPAAAAPGVITEGSGSVSLGGQAAARQGDRAGDAALAEGSSNVFINGRPAATVGDRTGCGGVTVGGAGNIFINGKPAARAGDLTTGCPGK